MKKLIALALIALGIAANSNAQTFGSGTNIWGTNIAPIQVSAGVYLTNSTYFYAPSKSLTLGNVTNENVISYFGWQLPSNWVLVPGQTNIYTTGFVTNTLYSTNGTSWSTNYPAYSASLNFPVYMGIVIQTNGGTWPFATNSAYVP